MIKIDSEDQEIKNWIEVVTGDYISNEDSLSNALKSGTKLCK
jgi:hypothetical protein